MAIEGIGNTYGVPKVKEERAPDMNKKKGQDKQKKEKRHKDENQEIIKDGKIDIRIQGRYLPIGNIFPEYNDEYYNEDKEQREKASIYNN